MFSVANLAREERSPESGRAYIRNAHYATIHAAPHVYCACMQLQQVLCTHCITVASELQSLCEPVVQDPCMVLGNGASARPQTTLILFLVLDLVRLCLGGSACRQLFLSPITPDSLRTTPTRCLALIGRCSPSVPCTQQPCPCLLAHAWRNFAC